jgi:serine protease Do
MKCPSLIFLVCGFCVPISTAQHNSSIPFRFGLTVSTPHTAQQRLAAPKGAVLISSVEPGSFAAKIGLYKGALILEINRQPVSTELRYQAVLSQLKPGDDVVFVLRDTNAKGGITYLGGKWLGGKRVV